VGYIARPREINNNLLSFFGSSDSLRRYTFCHSWKIRNLGVNWDTLWPVAIVATVLRILPHSQAPRCWGGMRERRCVTREAESSKVRDSGAVGRGGGGGWRGRFAHCGAFGYVGDTEIVLPFWKNGSDTRCLPLILERCGVVLGRSLKTESTQTWTFAQTGQ
jgi:hypothetical protein